MNLRAIRGLAARLALLLMALCAGTPACSSAAENGSGALTRLIRFSLTLQNPSNQDIRDASVWIYGPAARTGNQRLDRLVVNVPNRVTYDAAGNTIIELLAAHLGAYEARVVTVEARLSLQQPLPEPLPRPQQFLAPEKFIESDDADIQALATGLRNANASEPARAVFDWVRTNLTYAGYTPDELGARYALSHRSGDCTEYADLTAAVSRALAIPARTLGGFVVDRDAVIRARDYHNWTELYLNGAWRIVDAQKGVYLPLHSDYVTFHVSAQDAANPLLGAERFRSSTNILVQFE
jgi:transglutaminase-like putative cysteine protease